MKEKHIGAMESKENFYEGLEGFALEKIRGNPSRFGRAGNKRMAGARKERAGGIKLVTLSMEQELW
ncbi:MAG: hypothetical protein ACXWZE_01250 [Candidatus Binatia bacterium]